MQKNFNFVVIASLDDLEWADAIIFSVPTRFGNMAAQMKRFSELQITINEFNQTFV
jgi:multimeric flavodoxin WrbA